MELWGGHLAPGETEKKPDVENPQKDGILRIQEVTNPTLTVYRPEKQTSRACMAIFPGGGYYILAYGHEGIEVAQYLNARGMTAVVVKYRVPRRANVEKHFPAWQDAQRAIRWVRAHADELGIDPNKIGGMGFSAGGHLTLMAALNSETPAYEPVDDLDKVSCRLNFAAPVYPAYVLEDGEDSANKERGNDSELVSDFAFDTGTPPMCFIHGDADGISAMGSVAVYHKLRTMNLPAELHIFSKVGHGFGMHVDGDHIGTWMNRVYAWMKTIGME